MTPKFIITVDTEADNQWQKGAEVTLQNLDYVEKFQGLCESFGYIPTYLITYEVAAEQNFTQWLKEKMAMGKLDIGAHLHPWTNPPYIDEAEKNRRSFPCDLDVDILSKKIKNLTSIIKANTGARPISFRAGRWGVNQKVIEVIKKYDYKVDSSVTPFIDWQKQIKVAPLSMDFSKYDLNIFDWGGVLEVPMSIIPIPRLGFSFGSLGNKLFYRKRWCRIFPDTTTTEIDQWLNVVKIMNLPYLQFMIHSSELMPGGSIYNKDEKSIDHLYRKLEYLFSAVSRANLETISLSSFAKTMSMKVN